MAAWNEKRGYFAVHAKTPLQKISDNGGVGLIRIATPKTTPVPVYLYRGNLNVVRERYKNVTWYNDKIATKSAQVKMNLNQLANKEPIIPDVSAWEEFSNGSENFWKNEILSAVNEND